MITAILVLILLINNLVLCFYLIQGVRTLKNISSVYKLDLDTSLIKNPYYEDLPIKRKTQKKTVKKTVTKPEAKKRGRPKKNK